MLHSLERDKSEVIKALKSFPWEDKTSYGDYLAQTYYYVYHSERLLALAAARMSDEDRKMQRRFFAHLSEENSHDLMVKKDLENLGFYLKHFPERPETRLFWETQYYKIEHQDPAALLGYILLLEDVASSVCSWIFGEVVKYHGSRCGTFLRVHGEDDPGHVTDAIRVIETLSAHRRDSVLANLHQSKVAYSTMIEAIVKEFQNRHKAAA